MPFISINNKNYELKTEQEKIELNNYAFITPSWLKEGDMEHHYFTEMVTDYNFKLSNTKWSIIRNGIDDTFSFETNDVLQEQHLRPEEIPYSARSRGRYFPFFSLNNIKTFDRNNGLSLREEEHKWLGHWSLWSDQKFINSSSWTFGYEHSIGNPTPMLNWSVFTHIEKMNNIFYLKDNQALEFKTIKKINFSLLDKTDLHRMDLNRVITPESFQNQIFYTHLFFVPREINTENHNVTLADIYFKNDEEISNPSQIQYNYSIDNGKMKSSSLKDDLDVVYSKKITEESNIHFSDINSQTNSKIYKIGTYDLADFTYYDYEKNQTIKGLNSNSRLGELIPYSFHGSYNRNMLVTLNSSLKNISINISKEIISPFLDPDFGKIILELSYDNIDYSLAANEIYSMNAENIQKFRNALSGRNYIPLQGIRRYSDETYL